jgi:uncharacterized membrane protein YphA (DoxX/SURF4 family)
VRTTRDYLFGTSTAGPRADVGLPLLFLAIALMFASVGAGRYSADAQIERGAR